MVDPRFVCPACKTAPKRESEAFPGLRGLSRMSIVLGLGPVDLAEAAKRLVPKALHGAGRVFLRNAEISKALAEGIADKSCVELQRGLALLHLRVDELQEPRAAIGISAEGLNHSGEDRERVFVVALFLAPKRGSGSDIPHWARKKFCDERLLYRLRTAADLESVFHILLAERQEGE